jgi:hypothetical protein
MHRNLHPHDRRRPHRHRRETRQPHSRERDALIYKLVFSLSRLSRDATLTDPAGR